MHLLAASSEDLGANILLSGIGSVQRRPDGDPDVLRATGGTGKRIGRPRACPFWSAPILRFSPQSPRAACPAGVQS